MLTKSLSVRAFSSAAQAHAEAAQEVEEKENKVSNAFKNQHIRYIPPKRFVFNLNTNEGRMTQIFSSDYNSLKNKNRVFKMLTALAVPGIISASMLLPAS